LGLKIFLVQTSSTNPPPSKLPLQST